MKCIRCKAPAHVSLPSHHSGFCKDCYPLFFTKQVETAIRREKMFTHDDRVLVAITIEISESDFADLAQAGYRGRGAGAVAAMAVVQMREHAPGPVDHEQVDATVTIDIGELSDLAERPRGTRWAGVAERSCAVIEE